MRAALSAVLIVLSGCAGLRPADDAPLRGEGSGQPGMLRYTVGRLAFLAPDAWDARGGPRRVQLTHPGDQGRFDVQQVATSYADEKACLAAAEESLAKGAAQLRNVRRHQSTVAGRKAVAQEADQGAWHGWAYALCDGPTQYRLFFAGRTPVPRDVLDAMRALTKSLTLAPGEPGRA
jgi:hypothetical protein